MDAPRRRLHPLPATFVATLLALSLISTLVDAAVVDAEEKARPLGARLTAAFYPDTSCLLTIDEVARVGSTLIDATLGAGGSRTLLHCDTEDGQRLTLLARGATLGRRERVRLLERDSIERGASGVIAWLTREGTSFPDESAPRRYLSRGDVYIHEAPTAQVPGTDPHAAHHAFARVEGVLETLLSHPAGDVPAVVD